MMGSFHQSTVRTIIGLIYDLFQINYPFNRCVSSSCLIRYTQDQGGEIIGICSECSGVGANIKKDGDDDDFTLSLKMDDQEILPICISYAVKGRFLITNKVF